jgi:hypothetical protein
MKIPEFESKMIAIFQEIGINADSNCHYTALLAGLILLSTDDIEKLTVGQLLVILRKHNKLYNERQIEMQP